MKYDLAVLKRISGNSDDDQMIASVFCKEALREAEERFTQMETLCNLTEILDAEQFNKAINSLAGIRHIKAVAESAAEFHHGGKLGAVFDSAHLKLVELCKNAEENFQWLCRLLPDRQAMR